LILFSFLLLVLFASVVYLRAGDEIEVPSELGIVLSSVKGGLGFLDLTGLALDFREWRLSFRECMAGLI
jgi:hypothetical protein